ncbi:MAG: hypothetical protein JO234_03270, partial [Hyphomicrobiales bacterium]|nr:hypothetical protein [Hyphomicrobiales bacterium]
SAAFRDGALQAVSHSYFDGPLSFVVLLDGPDGRYGVRLHLSGTLWVLSGLDIPDALSARLAHEVADRQKAAG